MHIVTWDYIVATVTFGNPGEEYHKEKALFKGDFLVGRNNTAGRWFCAPLAPPCG